MHDRRWKKYCFLKKEEGIANENSTLCHQDLLQSRQNLTLVGCGSEHSRNLPRLIGVPSRLWALAGLFKLAKLRIVLNMGFPDCGPDPKWCWKLLTVTDSSFWHFLGNAGYLTGLNLLSLILSHSHYAPLPTDNPLALLSLYHLTFPLCSSPLICPSSLFNFLGKKYEVFFFFFNFCYS